MLKKVMIICLALSFVFVGGIGIALAGDPISDGHFGPNEPFGPYGQHGPNGSFPDFISTDSSIILAAQEGPGPNSGHYDEDGEPIIGPAPGSGDGISDGPEWPEWPVPDFISNDSSIIIAHGYDDDKGKGDQVKLRDDSC